MLLPLVGQIIIDLAAGIIAKIIADLITIVVQHAFGHSAHKQQDAGVVIGLFRLRAAGFAAA